jgi:hypothetical protein
MDVSVFESRQGTVLFSQNMQTEFEAQPSRIEWTPALFARSKVAGVQVEPSLAYSAAFKSGFAFTYTLWYGCGLGAGRTLIFTFRKPLWWLRCRNRFAICHLYSEST